MAVKKSRLALGRGLSNLIPIDTVEKGSENEIVPVDSFSIRPNPFQPRKEFYEDEIRGLAESIKNQGLLQPIILRKTNDGYEIISGERRLRALKLLGEDKIPAIIKPKVSDTEMLEMAVVENIQRENLNDIELAYSYQKLLFDCGLSHQQLSERVGKSRSVITNTLRLLKLPQEIQTMLRSGSISSGHARALLSIQEPEQQRIVAEKIVLEGLTVRDVEHIAHGENNHDDTQEIPPASKKPGGVKKREPMLDPDLQQYQEQIQYRFGTDVKITSDMEWKGKIEIAFYNKEDCNRILDLLRQ